MAMWNPWRGCKRCSDGCLHCYIHKGDYKRNIDTSNIVKTKDFKKPIEKLKNGNYKMKSGLVYTCFSTDFLIEEADEWRKECWQMIKERRDCTFLFLTKRIDRFIKCIPDDWNDEIGGTFHLLDRHWYNSSTQYVRGNVTYESPFILLRPFNRWLGMIQHERLYGGILFMPRLNPYVEVGYGIGTHIFDVGVFVNSMNGKFDTVGFKFTFELFND